MSRNGNRDRGPGNFSRNLSREDILFGRVVQNRRCGKSHLFTDFQACLYDFFFFPPDLTTNIEIIDLCMFWLPDLSVQTQINNKAFLKTCISHIYLAHVSRMCRLLFFCFDCWEYCFIVAFNEVEKIPKICISHVYLAHVSRMRVIVACVHTRVGSKVKSKFKFKPLHF